MSRVSFTEIKKLLREYNDLSGELHLIAFYSDEDGYVFRDRPKESDLGDFTKRIVCKFENLRHAKREIVELNNELHHSHCIDAATIAVNHILQSK